MEEENQLPTIMKCTASYLLKGNAGEEIARGAGNLLLDAEKLTLLPISNEPLLVYFREIIDVSKADYKIVVRLVSKGKLTLSDLGFKYEDFCRCLSKLVNDLMLKDLLMNETIVRSVVEVDCNYIDDKKTSKAFSDCELRIYETGLVIITGEGDFIRIPYSDLTQIRVENYALVLNTENSEAYLFSKMGKELDICFNTVNSLNNELSRKAQAFLKELLPGYDSMIIRKIAVLMKDGRAARRMDIEAVSPGAWGELEKRLDAFGIKEEYEYLKSLAQPERMCIGMKRGLMGDLTGEYIWFMAPIFSAEVARPGNAIAMEASSAEGSGRATYFFKITDETRYLSLQNLDELRSEADKALKKINRCLIMVNFRREPICLTDEQLNSPSYLGYQRAIQKLPSLQELRRLFIGRVIHHSIDQWKGDVTQLLKPVASAS